MKIRIKNKSGEMLCGILKKNNNNKEIVILCHGSRNTKDGNINFALEKELSGDFNVFRFDFSGNGESEGLLEDGTYTKDIEDILCVIDYFKKKKFKIKSIVGHSKAGSEVLLMTNKIVGIVESVVALAPRINLLNSAEMVECNKNIDTFNENGYYIFPTSRCHRITSKYIEDIMKWKNVLNHYDPRVEAFVIFGNNDKSINPSESVMFVDVFSEVKLEEIEGMDHVFNEAQYKVAKLVKKYLDAPNNL